jgi:hypothetical protein
MVMIDSVYDNKLHDRQQFFEKSCVFLLLVIDRQGVFLVE